MFLAQSYFLLAGVIVYLLSRRRQKRELDRTYIAYPPPETASSCRPVWRAALISPLNHDPSRKRREKREREMSFPQTAACEVRATHGGLFNGRWTRMCVRIRPPTTSADSTYAWLKNEPYTYAMDKFMFYGLATPSYIFLSPSDTRTKNVASVIVGGRGKKWSDPARSRYRTHTEMARLAFFLLVAPSHEMCVI